MNELIQHLIADKRIHPISKTDESIKGSPNTKRSNSLCSILYGSTGCCTTSGKSTLKAILLSIFSILKLISYYYLSPREI